MELHLTQLHTSTMTVSQAQSDIRWMGVSRIWRIYSSLQTAKCVVALNTWQRGASRASHGEAWLLQQARLEAARLQEALPLHHMQHAPLTAVPWR